MDVFLNFVSNLLSQGARSLFGAGSFFILFTLGGVVIGTDSILKICLILGLAFWGTAILLKIFDVVWARTYQRKIQRVIDEARIELPKAIEAWQSTDSYERSRIGLRFRNFIHSRRLVIRGLKCVDELKTRGEAELSIIESEFDLLLREKGRSGPHSWMGN